MIRRLYLLFVVCAIAVSPAAAQTRKASAPKKKASSTAAAKERKVAKPFPAVEESGPPEVRGEAFIVVDAQTGRVLHEKNADQQRPVASTQKLLTALIVAEEGNLDAKVKVKASDTWAEPSKLYIKAGEVYDRYKLLNVLLVKSMNDVALCLARDNAGSVERFAAKMNSKAQSLGMVNSNFVNPNGLPAPGQFSTARDMSKVALAAYRNRVIRGLVNQKNVRWVFNDGRTRVFETTNQVLLRYALCNGMKTGYTEAAGHCLISSASYGGREVIVVLLGDTKQVWNDSYRLLNWALSS